MYTAHKNYIAYNGEDYTALTSSLYPYKYISYISIHKEQVNRSKCMLTTCNQISSESLGGHFANPIGVTVGQADIPLLLMGNFSCYLHPWLDKHPSPIMGFSDRGTVLFKFM